MTVGSGAGGPQAGSHDRTLGEQAALRRVATLVARERSAGDVFDEIARELRALLHVEEARLGRYDGDALEIVAASGPDAGSTPTGTRLPMAAGPWGRVQ